MLDVFYDDEPGWVLLTADAGTRLVPVAEAKEEDEEAAPVRGLPPR